MGEEIAVRKIGFTNYFTAGVQLALILTVLYLISLYNFLVFHSMVELAVAVIAVLVFVITWNARRIIDNGYFLFLGVALLLTGGITLLHMLTYKGMGVFPENDGNLPTQLWIAGRYMVALAFLLAPFFIKRKFDLPLTVILCGTVFVLVLMSIFHWKNFPAAFIDGQGLTDFKKDSEYLISIMFGMSALAVYIKRKFFDRRVRRMIIFSLILAIASEISFTEYVGVYGQANMVGHLFLISSYYLLYLGIIETTLRRPSRILYKSLRDSRLAIKFSEEKLRRVNEVLEEKVSRRTYDLQKSNEKLNARNIVLKLASNTRSRKQFLNELVKLLKSWSGCSSVGIRVINDTGKIPYNSYTGFSRKFWDLENWLSAKNTSCICGRVVQGMPGTQDLKMMSDEGSFFCENSADFMANMSDEEKVMYRGNCAKFGYKTLGVIPIRYAQRTIGLIHIADQEEGKLSREKIEFLESLSSLIGTSIHKYNTDDSLEKSKRALTVLSTSNHILVHAESEAKLVEDICKNIVKLGGYLGAWIGYPVYDQKKSIKVAAQSGIGGIRMEEFKLTWDKNDKRPYPARYAIMKGKIQIKKYVRNDPYVGEFLKFSERAGFKSVISIPLFNKKIVIGALTIFAKESHSFDSEEVKLLVELANDLAFGINNFRIRKEKERSEKQLAESYKHLGMINRKISVLLDLDKNTKSKKDAGDIFWKRL